MSMAVDQRIVEMRFDNKQFEQNVSTTMSSIDKLKQSLNFKNAAESLDGLNTAANKVDFRQIESTACQAGFSIRDVWLKVATVFEYQIARRITHAASNIAKALTIDPIFTGFSEYETQINAIQTILANTESKGTTLTDVNEALDELNAYADKTIYNFTEMTRNIGTFTAAGVDLDTSVSAIKGIANLAAVSGSTSQQASTAMYQLSQALASGTVKLMDWNSVVNAGMGGQVFQDALKETARVHGIAIDDLIKQEGSFRETLSHGWLSSEILTETLSKFTGDLNAEQLKTMGYTEDQIEGILKMGQTANDAATKVKTFSQLFDTLKEAAQSGWTSTWEIIVGDFEEAKAMLTKVSDTIGGLIGESAEARNKLLGTWKVLGGRAELIDAITHAFDAVMSIVQAVSEAMKEVFPPLTAEKLVAFCTGLKELAQNFAEVFKVNGKTTATFNNLKRTLKGVFAIVDIVRQVFVALTKVIGKVFGTTGKLGGGLLEITGSIGDWLVSLRDALESSGLLERAVAGIGKVIDFVADICTEFGQIITESFAFKVISEGMHKFVELISRSGDEIDKFVKSTGNIKTAWENSGLYKFLTTIWNILKIIGATAQKVLGELFNDISKAFASGDGSSLVDLISGLLGGGLIAGLIILVREIIDLFSGIVGSIKDVLENVGDAFQSFQNKLNSDALRSIAKAIAILVASLVILSLLDENKLHNAIASMIILMSMLTAMTMLISKGSQLGKIDTTALKGASSLVTISFALLIAAGAFALLGSMDIAAIGRGILGMLGIVAMLVAAQIMLAKFGGDTTSLKKNVKAMRSMAVTLLLMCIPLAIIGTMEWATIGKGLTGILGILTLLSAAAIICEKFTGQNALKGAATMGVMAMALNSLIPLLLMFGLMSWQSLLKAVGGLIAILATMLTVQVLYSKLGSGIGKMLAGALAIGIMSMALNTLIPMLTTLGLFSWQSLLKAGSGLIAILGTMIGVQIIYSKLGGGIGKMVTGALAIGIMAGALNSLMPTLLTLSIMPWSSLLKAGVGLVGILTVLSLAMVIMGKFGGGAGNILAAALAMNIMSGAILGISAALLVLAAINPTKLLVSLLAIGVVLGGLVLLGHLITPVIAPLLSFAKAIALIGVGLLAAGAGITLFGVGLSVVATGIIALVGALVTLLGSIGMLAKGIVVVTAAIIEGIVRGIGAGIVAICEVLIEALPLIGGVLIELVITLCDVLIKCAPKIVETLLALTVEICKSLSEFIPPIVAALVRLITGVINALAQELPDLIKAVVNLLFAFVEGVINALGGMNPEGLLEALKNVGMLTAIMLALAAMAALAPAAMLGVLAMGVVVTELSLVLAALGAFASIPGLQNMIGKGGDLLQAIGTAIGQFVGGLVGGFAKGATADLPEIASNLSGFADNIGSFLNIAPSLSDSLKSLAGASIATSIADFFNFDGSAMDVFAKELPVLGLALSAFSANTANINPEQIKGAASAAEYIAEMTNHIPNSGGVVSWFAGDNSIAKFGAELGTLGIGIKAFANATMGVNPEQVKAAADAAKTIAEMTDHIPNSGGVVSWFAGDNSISKFSMEIGALGIGIKAFANATMGVNPEQVTAAAQAAKNIAEMTDNIPNSGGVVSWFAGDNSIANFSFELGSLGNGIKKFAEATAGVNPEQVKAAADAAKTLAEMTNHIPNSGGVVSWFAGDNSISNFSKEMGKLGNGIKKFAEATAGVNPEQVKAAADAAKTLAEMTNHIPNSGGVVSWFAGDNSIANFSKDMGKLGKGLNSFAVNSSDVDPAKVSSAANAAKTLAEMTDHIPNSGGVVSWFAGETSVSKFADQLPKLGEGIAGFANGLGDAKITNVEPAAMAAKALAEMTQYIPKEGGIKAWFTGETSVSKFADKLPELGAGLLGFSESIEGMNPKNVEVAATAAKQLGEMTEVIPNNSNRIVKFGTNLGKFGDKMKTFISNTKDVSAESTKGANVLVQLGKDAATIDSDKIKGVATALKELTKAAKNMEKDIKSDMKDAGKKAVDGYIKGMNDKLPDAKKAIADLVDKVADKASDKASAFETAGKDCVQGFANGIKKHKYLATDAGSSVGKAALEAAKKAVDSNSPSKEFMQLGRDSDSGFAIGLTRYADMVYDSAYAVGRSGVSGLGDSISKISRLVENGMDTQPTIRPVLDLSDVENGVGRIGGLFADTPIGIRANLGAITSMMGSGRQNGSNEDVVEALKELRSDIAQIKHITYNVNGVTYDDGSNVADAVGALIRAAKIERRV